MVAWFQTIGKVCYCSKLETARGDGKCSILEELSMWQRELSTWDLHAELTNEFQGYRASRECET